ncbi:hypothetical protein NEOLEDRAFT_1173907 [Neolentinus lepideus HHB14362 ss-1]|uniref:Uncharacterized protein n=1 Tax=Neolentinus lepideus HHB14362 ss-1 TaxID=1314782 RepID=A0A165W0R1_9AGAM|nr:hypothetical protein NEOLEDRAFT_1173907 [Neolentinus lepideus HHB14362 ss-1]
MSADSVADRSVDSHAIRRARTGYSATMLEMTFKNKRQTERLLKPELDNGNLTHHDYNLTANFFGGWSMYAPEAFGLVGLVLPYIVPPAALALFGCSKPVTVTRRAGFAFLLGGAGIFIGQGYYIQRQVQFIQQLENPKGFERAVDNVFHGINPRTPVQFKLPPIVLGGKVPDSKAKENDPVGIGMEPGKEVEEGLMVDRMEDIESPASHQAHSAASPSTSSSEAQPSSRPNSVWDKIRAANAAQGPQSSWNAIRRRSTESPASPPSSPASCTQSKARSGIPTGDNVQVLVIDENEDPERVVEQKRFDEMLEEERRRAAGLDGPRKGSPDKWL